METAVNPAVVQGRVEAAWVKGGPHRQGDGYVSGIWFFVVDDSAVLEEGLQLVQWSLRQAMVNIGCGYHVVPPEAQAKAQVAALCERLAILPKVLERFHDLAVLNHETSGALTAPQGRPVVGLLLEQLFEEEIAPTAQAREAFWRMHAKLMGVVGVPHGCEDAVSELKKFWPGLNDAQEIANSIMAARFSGADGVADLELDDRQARVPEGVIRTAQAEDAARLREQITEALRNTVVMLRPLHAVLRGNPDNQARRLVRAVLTAELERKLTDRKKAKSAVRHLGETAALCEHRLELMAMEDFFEKVGQAQLIAWYFVLTTPATLMRALALAQGN